MPTQQTDSISSFSRTAFRLVWYRLWSVAVAHSDSKRTGKMRSLLLCCTARVDGDFFALILSGLLCCYTVPFPISLLSKGAVCEDVLFIYMPTFEFFDFSSSCLLSHGPIFSFSDVSCDALSLRSLFSYSEKEFFGHTLIQIIICKR